MTTKKSNTSIYDIFATDLKMEAEGIELVYGGTGIIRVARAGGANARYTKVLQHKSQPYMRQITTGTIATEDMERILIETFAETIVLGWSGIMDKKGKEILFSVESCIKLFTDLPDLFADVREQAAKGTNFREMNMEADAGN